MSDRISRRWAALFMCTGALMISVGVDAAFAQSVDAVRKQANTVRQQQEMLIWTTDYEGVADGVAGPGTKDAIKKFQKRLNENQDGELTPSQYLALQRQGGAIKSKFGFRIEKDGRAGISVGVPVNLVSGPRETPWGNNWYGKEAGLSIDTLRFGPQVELKMLFDRLVSINNRIVMYQRLTDRWFVIAAYEGESAVYVKAESVKAASGKSEIRGFSIWMSKTRPKDYEALPSAMLSSFTPYETAQGGPLVDAVSAAKSIPRAPVNERPQAIMATGPIIDLMQQCWRGLGNCPRVLASGR